jgi:Spy/CpxP family protein refolding chaperone
MAKRPRTIIAIAAALLLSVATFAQQAQDRQPPKPGAASLQMSMADMMKMHDQMMAEMKSANAKLDQLVQKMDSATGDAKANATADVVKELVAQRKAMCDRMGNMHQQMMSGMTHN